MKIGIAGVGVMGSVHAAGWTQTGAELVGVVAASMQEAAPLAARYHLKVYPTFHDMLLEVDVVDLCTPTPLHHAMTLEAAAAKKHVVCEKPLARTTSQAREMIVACKKAGVHLLVAHVVRYFNEYTLAKDIVSRGEIGKPAVIRLHRGSNLPDRPAGDWLMDESRSGGILFDLMIHDYDYARWVGGEVESVFAKKISTRHPESPVEYGIVILKHRDGALSHIAGAWSYPAPVFLTRIEIAGDAGLIEFDSSASAALTGLFLNTENGSGVDLPSSPLSESPYVTQLKDFYAVLLGEKQPRVSAQDGLAAVQIAEAALQSAVSGKAVQLEDLSEALS